jgi:serine/threonine protein kinase
MSMLIAPAEFSSFRQDREPELTRFLSKLTKKKAAQTSVKLSRLALRPGDVFDFLQVTRCLDATKLSQIYFARNVGAPQSPEVAIKVFNTTEIEGEQTFAQERDILMAELHPSFPSYISDGKIKGKPYIAMEKMVGIELNALIDNDELPLWQIIDIMAQVLFGLRALHEANKVNRDLKPSNILLQTNGRVRLLDFGLVCDRGARFREIIGGTGAYMAIEQSRGEAVFPRSDLYSLGIILFEMLTGTNPMGDPGSSYHSIALQQSTELPSLRGRRLPPLVQQHSVNKKMAGDVVEELDQLIKGMTAKDPNQRYQCADDVLADLPLTKVLEICQDPSWVKAAKTTYWKLFNRFRL